MTAYDDLIAEAKAKQKKPELTDELRKAVAKAFDDMTTDLYGFELTDDDWVSLALTLKLNETTKNFVVRKGSPSPFAASEFYIASAVIGVTEDKPVKAYNVMATWTGRLTIYYSKMSPNGNLR